MKDSKKSRENKDNPIYLLNNIEDVNAILSEDELYKIREMFNSIDNFNEITEGIEKNIMKNRLNKNDFIAMFNLVDKIAHNRDKARPLELDYPEKMGLAKSFFELPEIISRRLFSK